MITWFCSVQERPHLVVCPASLVYNWEAELHRFAPSLKVCLMVGAASERSKLLEHYQDFDVVVTSYDLLRRDIDAYQDKNSYKHFKDRFETKIVKEEENDAVQRLHKMIQPFLLRRLKKDVLKDLPDKVEKVVYSKFDSEQDKLYKAAEKKL